MNVKCIMLEKNIFVFWSIFMYCSTFSFILLRTSPVAKIVCRIMSLSDQIYLLINGNVCKSPVTERMESCGKLCTSSACQKLVLEPFILYAYWFNIIYHHPNGCYFTVMSTTYHSMTLLYTSEDLNWTAV